jgi:hypothetical protein
MPPHHQVALGLALRFSVFLLSPPSSLGAGNEQFSRLGD